VIRYYLLMMNILLSETNSPREYEWSISVRHDTLVFVIQCNMFQFNEPSSGVIYKNLKKT